MKDKFDEYHRVESEKKQYSEFCHKNRDSKVAKTACIVQIERAIETEFSRDMQNHARNGTTWDQQSSDFDAYHDYVFSRK